MRRKSEEKSGEGRYGCPHCGCANATVTAEFSAAAPVTFSDNCVARPDGGGVDQYKDLEFKHYDLSEYTCCQCGRSFRASGYFVDGVRAPTPKKFTLVCEQSGRECWREHLTVDGMSDISARVRETLIQALEGPLTCLGAVRNRE